VITDHNVITSVDGLNALHGLDARFLVIRGEEVTDRFGAKPLHINALDPCRLVAPQGGTSALDVVQRTVHAIRSADGIPHVNHPSFGWALSADELAQVRDLKLFEIFNGHPQVNNDGGGGVPSLEAMWDQILSRGVLLYGVAVDDAHHNSTRPCNDCSTATKACSAAPRATTSNPSAAYFAVSDAGSGCSANSSTNCTPAGARSAGCGEYSQSMKKGASLGWRRRDGRGDDAACAEFTGRGWWAGE